MDYKILEQFFIVKTRQNSFATRYVHSETRYTALMCYLPDFHPIIENKIGAAIKHIERLRLDLCGDLYKGLQDAYDNLISDEAIIETFELNGYYFNEETLRIESV